LIQREFWGIRIIKRKLDAEKRQTGTRTARLPEFEQSNKFSVAGLKFKLICSKDFRLNASPEAWQTSRLRSSQKKRR
jgi:hypothetical protein